MNVPCRLDDAGRCRRCGQIYSPGTAPAKTWCVGSKRQPRRVVERDVPLTPERRQFRDTLRKLILSKVTESTRQPAEIESLLDGLPEMAWPCGGCPEKVYGFIAAVLDSAVWREEWGNGKSLDAGATRPAD